MYLISGELSMNLESQISPRRAFASGAPNRPRPRSSFSSAGAGAAGRRGRPRHPDGGDECLPVASESLDAKRASTLLFGLQVASMEVRRTAQKRVITKK